MIIKSETFYREMYVRVDTRSGEWVVYEYDGYKNCVKAIFYDGTDDSIMYGITYEYTYF